MRIQRKLPLFVFMTIINTGVATTMVGQRISKSIIKRSIYNHLETTAESRAEHVETFLEAEKEAIKQLSRSIVIGRLLLARRDDRDYIQKLNDATRRLVRTAEIGKYTYDIFVLDKNGMIIVSSEEEDVGEDKSNEPYFLGGKEGTFIKDAYYSSKR